MHDPDDHPQDQQFNSSKAHCLSLMLIFDVTHSPILVQISVEDFSPILVIIKLGAVFMIVACDTTVFRMGGVSGKDVGIDYVCSWTDRGNFRNRR